MESNHFESGRLISLLFPINPILASRSLLSFFSTRISNWLIGLTFTLMSTPATAATSIDYSYDVIRTSASVWIERSASEALIEVYTLSLAYSQGLWAQQVNHRQVAELVGQSYRLDSSRHTKPTSDNHSQQQSWEVHSTRQPFGWRLRRCCCSFALQVTVKLMQLVGLNELETKAVRKFECSSSVCLWSFAVI